MRELILAAVLGAVVLARPAWAADPKLDADRAFEEGKQLFQAGRFEAAFSAFERSYAIDASLKTLLLMGVCQKNSGHAAAALRVFTQARALAKDGGRPDELAFAQSQVGELDLVVDRVTVVVSASVRATRPTVELDGGPLAEGQWDTELLVERGRHHLVVRAVGYQPRTFDLEANGEGARRAVLIDTLERTPAPVLVRRPHGLDPLAVTLVASGAGFLGVGIGFGVDAISRAADARDRCPQTACPDATAVDQADIARRSSVWSTVGFVGGLVLATAGVVWALLPGPARTASGLRFGPGGGELSF
jgi:hypothetical protein